MKKYFILSVLVLFTIGISLAQNPLVKDQFTADPSARVFNDRVYVFPSHDIPCTENRGRVGWFCMEDYHVFSSKNLVDWTDHGVIVSQYDVKWANTDTYSMWAPDCISLNGKYYFYFPTIIKDTVKYWKGYGIGVAVADKPEGPYSIQPEPIAKVKGIDPNIFIDKDRQAYLYWSGGHIYGAKLADNMLELASEPKILGNLPSLDSGLKEGPYMVERDGTYYLTYPHVANKTERLEYAIGDNPMGPFEVKGVIMDEHPSGCWTNHHSIINYEDQWYLFYHHNDYSPDFDKNRSIRVDSLFFNEDGTIQKVEPTLRGVALTDAVSKIQIDRYSDKSSNGVSISFLDSLDRFKGWKVQFFKKGAWVKYNGVDFGDTQPRLAKVRTLSKKGGTINLHLNNASGPLIASFKIPGETEWQLLNVPFIAKGDLNTQDLYVSLNDEAEVEIDWISFE